MYDDLLYIMRYCNSDLNINIKNSLLFVDNNEVVVIWLRNGVRIKRLLINVYHLMRHLELPYPKNPFYESLGI